MRSRPLARKMACPRECMTPFVAAESAPSRAFFSGCLSRQGFRMNENDRAPGFCVTGFWSPPVGEGTKQPAPQTRNPNRVVRRAKPAFRSAAQARSAGSAEFRSPTMAQRRADSQAAALPAGARDRSNGIRRTALRATWTHSLRPRLRRGGVGTSSLNQASFGRSFRDPSRSQEVPVSGSG